ncbi:7-carboxy-7-deazaguanine synthase [Gammaproteobacteria bacterium]
MKTNPSVYSVKEIFYSLQGEGAHSGRPAVFCRFSGCNLWSGREEDRSSAICQFCDTDFVGINGQNGGRFSSAQTLAEKIISLWPKARKPYLVCTGGEPLLQIDDLLIDTLHKAGCQIALETNGTLPVPNGIDWLCVSPKANTNLSQTFGNELKLVYPQFGLDPSNFEFLDFDHFFLQPMDGPKALENKKLAVRYCLEHPHWKLSLQIHKYLGIK